MDNIFKRKAEFYAGFEPQNKRICMKNISKYELSDIIAEKNKNSMNHRQTSINNQENWKMNLNYAQKKAQRIIKQNQKQLLISQKRCFRIQNYINELQNEIQQLMNWQQSIFTIHKARHLNSELEKLKLRQCDFNLDARKLVNEINNAKIVLFQTRYT